MRRSLRVLLDIALLGLAFSGYVQFPGRIVNRIHRTRQRSARESGAAQEP